MMDVSVRVPLFLTIYVLFADAEEGSENVNKTSEEKESSEASKPDEDEENDSPEISSKLR